MKRFAHLSACLIALALLPASGAFAQETPDHVNVGVFGNYVRLNDGGLNLAGVGARVSFNVLPVVQLEAESAYDFDQAFTQGFPNNATGSVSDRPNRCAAARWLVRAEIDDEQRARAVVCDREGRIRELQHQQ